VTPAVVVARTAAAAALARARVAGTRDPSVKDMLRDERLAAAALKAAESMGQMKGALMKVGQLLSFVDLQYVPPAFRDALAMLQADAPAMPEGLAEEVVAKELGAPAHEVFEYFSPRPIAAASIGQVHMARLAAGDVAEAAEGAEPVELPLELIVKVQYPGIADAVAADLQNAALLSAIGRLAQPMLKAFVPKVDVDAIVDEVRDRVLEELDYRSEAANQQEFAELWADDPGVHIPAVVPELSTERVLTMEYVDAMRWGAAKEAPAALRSRWGANIVRFVFGSLYRHRIFNADPHPGNYLFHEDGGVTFLDFGCVKRFDEETHARLRGMALAVRSGDPDRLLEAFMAMGSLKSREGFDEEVLVDYIRRGYEPLLAPQPFTYTSEWAEAAMADLVEIKFGKKEREIVRQLDLPPDHVFLLRITAGLNSVLASLGATVDWDELGAELWEAPGG
jgi:predicted unusual protein kinase regulating ubiquinone biosynthesis (AarF/ABC1/UbiB family)